MDQLSPRTIWYTEQITPELIQASGVREVIYEGFTKYQKVQILDTGSFGRILVLDGKTQSSESDEWVYHEALVPPAMLAHPNPKKVLVAGGGEGSTIKEVLRHHSVEELTMVDLDAEVVNLCKQYLPNHHLGSFEDKRLKLLHEDALLYLQGRTDPFDVIIIDIPDPLEGGPAYLLYTVEFYKLILSNLSPGGIMVAQSGAASPTNYMDVFTSISKTMRQVFAHTSEYRVFVPSFGTMWGFIACGREDALVVKDMDRDVIDREIEKRISSPLRYYDGIAHSGMFNLPKYIRSGISSESRIITNDNPVFVI